MFFSSQYSSSEIELRLRVMLALYALRPGEVARQAGCAPETLSRILAGAQRPSPDLARRIELAILRMEVQS